VSDFPRLRAFALSLARDKQSSDDVEQETAAKALRARSQFDPGTSFAAWTFRILQTEY